MVFGSLRGSEYRNLHSILIPYQSLFLPPPKKDTIKLIVEELEEAGDKHTILKSAFSEDVEGGNETPRLVASLQMKGKKEMLLNQEFPQNLLSNLSCGSVHPPSYPG